MKIQFANNKCTITLQGIEKLWAVHSGTIELNCDHIVSVSVDEPEFNWKRLRAPGTSIPWFFHAGTFYTPLGKEFWYFFVKQRKLTITLSEGPYMRVIVSHADIETVYEQLRRITVTDKG